MSSHQLGTGAGREGLIIHDEEDLELQRDNSTTYIVYQIRMEF